MLFPEAERKSGRFWTQPFLYRPDSKAPSLRPSKMLLTTAFWFQLCEICEPSGYLDHLK